MNNRTKLRQEYHKETGNYWKKISVNAEPTLDYIKWLENRLNKGQTLPLDSVSVSAFSDEEIHKAASDWQKCRSIGDKAQDRNCYYDFRKGMEAMFRMIQDSR